MAETLNIHTIVSMPFAENTYVVWLPDSTETIVFDPGLEPELILDYLREQGLSVAAILNTHGHGDHIGDAVEVVKQHNPLVVGIYELCLWMAKKGAKQISPMNKGGSQTVGDIKVTMVHADHSCGIQDGDQILYGGEAVGFVIEFENGVKIYHAGDTNVFGDMKIIHDLYNPEIVMLPIGDHFTMSPREAAYAAKLLQAKTIIPMHFATFPVLTGRPSELHKLIPDIEVFEMKPGVTV